MRNESCIVRGLIPFTFLYLSRYSWAVRPPPQDSERSKEDRWGITARKSPIGSTNRQWGMKKNPH